MTIIEPAIDPDQRASAQRRTLQVLFSSVVFGRAGMTLGFALAALLVKDMLGTRWAGLSTVAITIGTAVSATMLSKYMNKSGRRPGLALGYFIAAGGGAVAMVGAQTHTLLLFLAGLVLVGVGAGSANLARYAAADLALPEAKAKAISFIVFASTLGAVGGPTLVKFANGLGTDIGLDDRVGPYAFTVLFFAIAGVIVLATLRPDPLVLIGGLDSASKPKKAGFVASLGMIWAHPMARLAMVSLVISQAVMVGVMAMTPLHMEAHGHDDATVGFIIATHTAGMFAFAPLAGWASDRFGRIRSIAFGAAVLVVATAMTALAADAPNLLMFPGLYLLGLGWSFGMVAGSTLLTESVSSDDRVSAQGAADLMASIVSGVAAMASGLVLDMAGYHILSMLGIVAAGVLLVAGFVRDRHVTLMPDAAA